MLFPLAISVVIAHRARAAPGDHAVYDLVIRFDVCAAPPVEIQQLLDLGILGFDLGLQPFCFPLHPVKSQFLHDAFAPFSGQLSGLPWPRRSTIFMFAFSHLFSALLQCSQVLQY